MNHLSETEILRLAAQSDSNAAAGTARTGDQAATHLSECSRCAARVRFARQVETALHEIPEAKVSDGFARSVLRAAGIAESPSFLWTAMKTLSSLVGMVIVAAAILYLPQLMGWGDGGAQPGSGLFGSVSGYGAQAGEMAEGLLGETFAWLTQMSGTLFTGGAGSLILYLAALFVAASLLDKFFLEPAIRRRR